MESRSRETSTKGQSGPHIKFKAVGKIKGWPSCTGRPCLKRERKEETKEGKERERERGKGERKGGEEEEREETTSDLILSLPHPPPPGLYSPYLASIGEYNQGNCEHTELLSKIHLLAQLSRTLVLAGALDSFPHGAHNHL